MTSSAGSVTKGLAPAVRLAFERLSSARRNSVPSEPVRDLLAADDVEGAYAVQQALVALQVDAGATVTGRKIGLTAPAVQAQLGVDQPDFGVLRDDMLRTETEPIRISDLLQPKVEAEVAFTLSADITDPDCDATTVRNAIAFASPALEIVDSRIANWDITFVDTVADNASSGLYVLGKAQVPLSEFEPRDTTMTMTLDGEQVSTGTGEACLGDPLNAVAWLARTAIAYGQPLCAGQVILSGALGPMAVVTPGHRSKPRLPASDRSASPSPTASSGPGIAGIERPLNDKTSRRPTAHHRPRNWSLYAPQRPRRSPNAGRHHRLRQHRHRPDDQGPAIV